MTNWLIYILVLLNSIWLIYLTYLFYKRNQPKLNISKLPLTSSDLKISLTRFNPFDEVGGDQSFILCLLDRTNTGVIITSLHHRDLTRVYAKSIKHGTCENSTLSQEEKTALSKLVVKE